MPYRLKTIGPASTQIAVAIGGAAVIGLGAIAGVILWITVEFNTAAQGATRKVIETGFREIIQSLVEITESHARWTMMFDAVTQGRSLLLDNDVGYLVYQRDIFDFVAFTDHAGTPEYAYMDHDRSAGPEAFPRSLLNRIVTDVREVGAPWSDTVSGVYRVGDAFAIVAASAVTPTNGMRPGLDKPHFMIAGRYLDPLAVPAVQEFVADRDMVLAIGDIVPQPNRNHLRLQDARGRTSGALIWRSTTPGYDVLRSSAPVIAVACIVLFLSGLFVLRASDSLRSALKKEGDIARTDPLTGLPNRTGLEDFFAAESSKAALTAGHVAVLYLDLNGFKLLNDTEGHANGDAALQIVANRLQRSLRADDLAARVGGDEFLCVILDPDPREAARSIISRIEANTAPPIRVNGTGYALHPAIGHAIARPGDIWKGLVSRADADMYRAKHAAGKARLDVRLPHDAATTPRSTMRTTDTVNAA